MKSQQLEPHSAASQEASANEDRALLDTSIHSHFLSPSPFE